jgi:hypothetical protein
LTRRVSPARKFGSPSRRYSFWVSINACMVHP